jgi:hypothetical protein
MSAAAGMDLRRALPLLLPAAIAWAEQRARHAAQAGTVLPEEEIDLARRVGVRHPERVRVEIVQELPVPEAPALRAAAAQAGLVGPGMAGLTLGHAIFIRRGHKDTRLLSHELRHVYQYEQHGSIAAFLAAYLPQVVECGYAAAPLEADARAHEVNEWPASA